MDEATPERGAALSGCAHCCKRDGSQSEVEISRLADDGCIVSAEFEDGASEAACEARRYLTAHGG